MAWENNWGSPPMVREHLLGDDIWEKSWRERAQLAGGPAGGGARPRVLWAEGTVRVEPEMRDNLAWQVLGTDTGSPVRVFWAVRLQSGTKSSGSQICAGPWILGDAGWLSSSVTRNTARKWRDQLYIREGSLWLCVENRLEEWETVHAWVSRKSQQRV